MRRHFILSLALLFIALGVPSNAQSETTTVAASADELAAPLGPAGELFYYDVGRPFALNCTLPAASGSTAYVWRKNGTAVEQVAALLKRYSLEEGGAVLRLAGRTTEDDYGNYSCELAGAQLAFDVRGRPHAKLQHNVNVVEKQPLKITCKMIGKPYPAVSWTFTNESHNGTAVEEALGAERVTLRRSEQGVERGELALEGAERSDAGLYTCVPVGGTPAETTLRVKDQFAALWPFLGICAEVFVLCAIILVYERRRTKPELDDSDTDNHEQKKS